MAEIRASSTVLVDFCEQKETCKYKILRTVAATPSMATYSTYEIIVCPLIYTTTSCAWERKDKVHFVYCSLTILV